MIEKNSETNELPSDEPVMGLPVPPDLSVEQAVRHYAKTDEPIVLSGDLRRLGEPFAILIKRVLRGLTSKILTPPEQTDTTDSEPRP